MTTHTDYIRHTQEEVVTLRKVVESERLLSPLNTSLIYACKYTRRIQELLMILQQTCPYLPDIGTKLEAITPKNKTKQIRHTVQVTKSESITVTTLPSTNLESNKPVLSSTGVNLVSSASGSLSQGNTKNNRIRQKQKKAKKNKVEDHLRTVKSSLNKAITRKVWKTTGKVFKNVGHIWKPTGRKFTLVRNVCPLTRIATPTIVPPKEPILIVNSTDKPVVTLVVQIILWYLDSSCSKHMIGDRSQLVNFVQKFLGTVKFGNDHVAKIMGYGDYQIGNVTIFWVYYVEGLGHNLFSVGQFCDSDLEVAFRQHTCFIRNLDGVDLLTGSRGNNLYTLSIQDMMASSPICLLSKVSKTKSWLWHRCLSHLNFGAINHLARQGLVRGLPKLKFEKDHLCSACAMGKSTRKTHKPKSEDTNQEKLYLRHMDLCGPMRVESVNGKKYIPVIVDDYSRLTWVKFLRSKDETLDFIINSGPALNEMTPGTISSGLMPTTSPLTSYVPPSRNDWDLLFQPMFDELLNPHPSVVNQAPEAIAPIVEQDAPSTSNSTTPTETQSSIIPQDIGDDNLDMEVANIGSDMLFGIPILEVTSDQFTTPASPQAIVQTDHPLPHHNSKWTKDHPLNNIIGQLDRPVSTRLQLHEQALFCYYDAFLTSVEPKTYKEALTQSCWIEAMQEELHEFER
nr:retrovirus-related Pol polyprotein from transposon TNT 1-94 [Tanacetum cinerariifolium]